MLFMDFFKKPTKEELEQQLHLAVYNKEYQKVKKLLQKGIRFNSPHLLYFNAIKNNDCAMMKLLAEFDVPVINNSPHRKSLLIKSIYEGNEDAVDFLLANGINPNERCLFSSYTPLFKVVTTVGLDSKKRERIINKLVNNGANVNLFCEYGSPLLGSIIKNNEKSTEQLLKLGADINAVSAQNNTALMCAINNKNNIDCLQKILKLGANVNYQNNHGETALMLAVEKGLSEHIDLLLKQKPDLTLQNSAGKSVLHYALDYADINHFKELIQLGAPLDLQTKSGNTALINAVYQDNDHFVSTLILSGADCNIKNNKGLSAIHYAIQNQEMTSFKLLVSHAHNINAEIDNNGRTALIAAVRKSNLQMVKTLLDAGANSRLIDKHGLTALDYAQQKKQEKIIRLLEDVAQDFSIDIFNTFLYSRLKNKTRLTNIERYRLIFQTAQKFTGKTMTDKNISPEQKNVFDYAKLLVTQMSKNNLSHQQILMKIQSTPAVLTQTKRKSKTHD